MSNLRVIYVVESDNTTPRLDGVSLPPGATWCSPNYAVRRCGDSGSANIVWVVRGRTEAAKAIRENGTGRISTYSTPDANDWLKEVADDPADCSSPCGNILAVPAVGLASTEAGRRAQTEDAYGIPGARLALGGKVNPEKVQESINRAIAGGGLKLPEEPKAEPRTTLVTQVEVMDAVDPIGDTLHYAKEAAGVDRDAFPEDGLVSIQWTKVHGRTNLRKFTITVDFKESN
ncbi:hypothetical protein AUR04nite_00720 [Glutamicibacter uratoxydans]|uniref:Uncharacterized protein n=1 Tax=Glutamicibacter uratoxydans TaxID=43667 RepID=A0A4Y4DLP0_GLUUR|nr:hypothetical protein [Glutamicibacter uratoxydans]GED04540.1 hypothetical protein AUR04nite_00720 [Glutamicibacter uratoxydans]